MFIEYNLTIGSKEQSEIKIPLYKQHLFMPYSINFHLFDSSMSFDIKGLCGNTTLFDYNSSYFLCENAILLNNIVSGTNEFIVRIKNTSNKSLVTNLIINYQKIQTIPLILTKTLVPNEFNNLSFLENYTYLDKLVLLVPFHNDYSPLELTICPKYNLILDKMEDQFEFDTTMTILGSKTTDDRFITFSFNLKNLRHSDLQYLTLQNKTLINLPSDLKIHSFVYGLH